MEAQGNLIADYFLVKLRGDTLNISESRYRHFKDLPRMYEEALSDFLADPGDPANLPKVTE